MKDTAYLHATMRVRALERNLLSRERVERMLEARTVEEAVKALAECGYTGDDWESMLRGNREETYALMASLSEEDTAIVEVFRLRYDYHNLKVLVKSGDDKSPLMMEMGCKEMTEVGEEAREVLARTGDPQQAEFILDRALARDMAAAAEGSPFLQGYVALWIDWNNLRAVARTLRLGREPDFLRGVLMPGGQVDVDRIVSVVVSGGNLADLYVAGPLEEAAAAAQGPLVVFERLGDNAVIRYLKTAKGVAFGQPALAGYLGAKEAEWIAVRVLLAGREAGVSADALRERLRECYV